MKHPSLSRLRGGEVLAGFSGVWILLLLFTVDWYGPAPRATGAPPRGALTGWETFPALSWALILCGVLALLVAATQLVSRGPALPVSVCVVLALLALLTFIWLVVDLAVGGPSGEHRSGGWLELLALAAAFAGAIASLRQEGIHPEDGPGEIPVVSLHGAAT